MYLKYPTCITTDKFSITNITPMAIYNLNVKIILIWNSLSIIIWTESTHRACKLPALRRISAVCHANNLTLMVTLTKTVFHIIVRTMFCSPVDRDQGRKLWLWEWQRKVQAITNTTAIPGFMCHIHVCGQYYRSRRPWHWSHLRTHNISNNTLVTDDNYMIFVVNYQWLSHK